MSSHMAALLFLIKSVIIIRGGKKVMRRLSNIFLLVGGICAILCAVAYFFTAIIFFMAGIPAIADYIRTGLEYAGVPEPDKIVTIIQACSIALGVFMLIMMGICIPSIVVAFKAQRKPEKKLLILNIVFGYLSGSTYNMVGGILGLIYNKKLERKQVREANAQ